LTSIEVLLDVLAGAAMIVGTFFMVVTGIGLVRFPDVYTRMHAAGKAGTVGVALLILAPTLAFGADEPHTVFRGLLAIVFQFMTTPGATYLLAHACYVTSYPSHERTELDELREWLPTYADDEFGQE
jgi:multicomponent Na+:H+ antiporter subunit G